MPGLGHRMCMPARACVCGSFRFKYLDVEIDYPVHSSRHYSALSARSSVGSFPGSSLVICFCCTSPAWSRPELVFLFYFIPLPHAALQAMPRDATRLVAGFYFPIEGCSLSAHLAHGEVLDGWACGSGVALYAFCGPTEVWTTVVPARARDSARLLASLIPRFRGCCSFVSRGK